MLNKIIEHKKKELTNKKALYPIELLAFSIYFDALYCAIFLSKHTGILNSFFLPPSFSLSPPISPSPRSLRPPSFSLSDMGAHRAHTTLIAALSLPTVNPYTTPPLDTPFNAL